MATLLRTGRNVKVTSTNQTSSKKKGGKEKVKTKFRSIISSTDTDTGVASTTKTKSTTKSKTGKKTKSKVKTKFTEKSKSVSRTNKRGKTKERGFTTDPVTGKKRRFRG